MMRICVTAFSLFLFIPLMAHAEVIGRVFNYAVSKNETLFTIARKFDLSMDELVAANPTIDAIDLTGKFLTIPAAHVVPDVEVGEIVINLAERRLFYRPSKKRMLTFPVAIGKAGWETPLGETTVVRKRQNPIWTPPESVREENPNLPASIPAGPDNPLGAYALNLGWDGFIIHGTNAPNSIGRKVSHGCIRMYPEDIARLYPLVEIGTKVQVIHQAYKIGVYKNELYLEVSPASTVQPGQVIPLTQNAIDNEIRKTAPQSIIDWEKVYHAIARREGVPEYIGVVLN